MTNDVMNWKQASRRALVYLLLPAIAAVPAWSWGDVGHMTVGRIAAKHLKPSTRTKVATILGVDDTAAAVANAMAEAAVWADHVARNEFPETPPWHFIDLSLLNGESDTPDPFQKDNTAYTKIVHYAGTLKAGEPDELEPGSDLKLLIHFVGDIHQPLHCATDQDRGGNCVSVRLSSAAHEKLHHAWDTSIVEASLGADPRTVSSHLDRHYRQLPASEKTAVRGPDLATTRVGEAVRAWVMQSHNLALSSAYKPLNPPVPLLAYKEVDSKCKEAPQIFRTTTFVLHQDYQDAAADTIERQLISGGIRLANLLNSALE